MMSGTYRSEIIFQVIPDEGATGKSGENPGDTFSGYPEYSGLKREEGNAIPAFPSSMISVIVESPYRTTITSSER